MQYSVVSNSYRSIWNISFPIVIGLVAQNLMMVIDTAFLGRLGEVSLGAAAIGGLLHLTLVMLGTGFGIGMQILIGRRNGEGNHRVIGRLFDHGIYMLIALAVFMFAIISLVGENFLDRFVESQAVLEESKKFMHYRRYGFFIGLLNVAFNSFFVGIVKTRVVSTATIIMATSNVFLNYILIFGKMGFPAMGISGAALATNISEGVAFLFYLGYVFIYNYKNRYRLFRFQKAHGKLYSRIFKIAGPVMLQYFIAFSAWFAFFLVLERIGETALAASNITRSIYMFLMIPVWGLSSATTTLISNLIGQGKREEVMAMMKKIVLISFISNLIFVQTIVLFPAQVVSVFTSDPSLIAATIPILRIIVMALIVFSAGMIVFSTLSGTGKTTIALIIEIISITIYLSVAFFITTAFDATAPMVWFVEVIYFGIMGLAAFFVLKRGAWKKLQI
ncbi:MAG TPA: MATE family efflux transporter [Bacteroidales bacterium]|nr:MATE family efflux transporter [Bacteroidales bacterium]